MKKHQIDDMPGKELKRRLEDAGYSQARFAREIGVTPQHLHRVIFNKDVSDPVLRKIAEAIGMDVKLIRPSIYLYSAPRKPGRPKSYQD